MKIVLLFLHISKIILYRLIVLYFQCLSTQDTIINQNILHVIVTAAIDFIDIESEKYKQIKANINLGNTVMLYCLNLKKETNYLK